MKIAVISDIHGNAPAFKAVLEDAKKQGVTEYIIAGDYCLSGPYPDECISIMRGLERSYIIRGNEEQYLENLDGKDQSKWTDGQMQISYWSYRNVSVDNRKFLFDLPRRIDLKINGVDIHIAHMRSEFADEYIETGLDDLPDMDEAFKDKDEGVYIFGHSHIQWSYRLKDKNIVLINPGSCGMPLDLIRNSMPYTVLEISDEGEISVDQRRVPFDVEAYIEDLKKTTQYTDANVWSKVIIKELRYAKEHIAYFLPFVEKYAQEIGDDRRPFAVETWERAYEIWNKGLEGNNVK